MMPAAINALEKNLPAGLLPRDGQKEMLMAVNVLRNPAFFKAGLAIDHSGIAGDGKHEHRKHL